MPLLSVVVKVTAAFDTTLPALSRTNACSVPGRSGDTEVMALPDASISVICTLPAVAPTMLEPSALALALLFNLSHKLAMPLTQVDDSPPPQPPRPSASNIAVMLITLMILVFMILSTLKLLWQCRQTAR